MKYPDKVAFEDLEKVAPEVNLYKDVYECIDDLLEGGERLKTKITHYLVKKPDEDEKVYSYRKRLFTYTPILPQCVSQLINRFSTGKYIVEGLKKNKKTFWENIRADLDLVGTKEKEFIKQIFERLIRYKTVYAVVDYSEEEKRPFVILLDPRHVVDYGMTDGRLEWVKIRKLVEENPPIGETESYLEWTYIDEQTITTYRERVVKTKEGKYQPWQPQETGISTLLVREMLRGERKGTDVKKLSQIPHNMGRFPVVRLELPDELWVMNQAIFLALEHVRVHNNMAYTATLAGQIQRLFTPIRETLDEVIDMEEARFQTGNERVLIGENFSFNETTGSALKTVGEYLNVIEAKIKDLIFNTGVTTEGLGTADQSGVSKSLDYVGQEKALGNYGERVANFYEKILRLICEFEGFSPKDTEKVVVLGLDEFSLDPLETKIDRLKALLDLDIPVSQTAMRLISSDIQQSMVGGVSNEEKATILEELVELYPEERKADLETSYIQDFVLDQLISKTTARELLGFDPELEEERINEEAIEDAERSAEVNAILSAGEMGAAPEGMPDEGAMQTLGDIDTLLDPENPALDEMETEEYEALVDQIVNQILSYVPPEEQEAANEKIYTYLDSTEYRDEELNFLYELLNEITGGATGEEPTATAGEMSATGITGEMGITGGTGETGATGGTGEITVEQSITEVLDLLDALLAPENPAIDELEEEEYEQLIAMILDTIASVLPPESVEESLNTINEEMNTIEYRDEELNYLYEMLYYILNGA